MSKKNKPDSRGYVYSTDPNFRYEEEASAIETLPPEQQKLKVRLDTKHRAGKAVTLIEGFIGTADDLEDLGTGGSAKDNVVIIQGDQREKVMQWLAKNGYTNSKRV
jgi:translation initiation factor 1